MLVNSNLEEMTKLIFSCYIEIMKTSEIKTLPSDFDNLAEEASLEGHGFLLKMKAEWVDGKNRFDKNGETVFIAINESNRLVGICGLNVDPYAADPLVGRVRHLYVAQKYRRAGVGKALVEKVLESGKVKFRVLRLRTLNPKADLFYRALGFVAVAEPDSTHIWKPNN